VDFWKVKDGRARLLLVKGPGFLCRIRPLEKLFRIDEILSTSGTEDEEGTGLGLVLCKEMIEEHEGRKLIK